MTLIWKLRLRKLNARIVMFFSRLAGTTLTIMRTAVASRLKPRQLRFKFKRGHSDG